MPSSHLRSLLAVVLTLCAQRASAFLDPPYITPANPIAGVTISINVYGGECDVLNIGIVPPVIEQNGAAITILFTGIHEGDPEWCYFSLTQETYPVGSFPMGVHTLDVERRYMSIGGDWVQETLGIIPFAVSGGPPPHEPIEAPALSLAGLASLCLVLLVRALLVLRLLRRL